MVEGWLIERFVNHLQAIDLRRAPLTKLVPNLDQLLATPAEYLAERDVVIAPSGMPAMVAMLAIFFGMLLGPCLIFPIVAMLAFVVIDAKIQLNSTWFPICAVLGILTMLFVLRWLTMGQRMVLSAHGVEIGDRKSMIKCPWALFHVTDRFPGLYKEHLLIPIAATVVDAIECHSEGQSQITGPTVRTKFFWIGDGPDAVIPNGFKCEGLELGMLLRELGQKLG